MVKYGMVQYCMVQYGTIWYNMVCTMRYKTEHECVYDKIVQINHENGEQRYLHVYSCGRHLTSVCFSTQRQEERPDLRGCRHTYLAPVVLVSESVSYGALQYSHRLTS